MTKVPKVSVIMSVYNCEPYIEEAIESIIFQDFTDFEVIIIDDGCTDKTMNIIENQRDGRIKIIHNGVNMGLTLSLNKALQYARGEYIARMDGDDISLPYRLKKQVEFLHAHPQIGHVSSHLIKKDEGETAKLVTTPFSHKEIVEEALVRHDCFNHQCGMLRRACYDLAGSYRPELLFCEDFDFCLRLSEKRRFANIQEALFIWRRHPLAISEKYKALQREMTDMALRLYGERRTRGSDSLDRSEERTLRRINGIRVKKI